MKILVTGGAGFIGKNLVKELLARGHSVIILDDLSTGDTSLMGADNLIFSDIADIEYIEPDYDVCFHLAALSRIQPSFEYPDRFFITNVLGTEKVLEWARRGNVKVVYAGSSSVHYDFTQSPYATTKHLGELLCKMYHRVYGVKVDIARFYNVYGEGEILEGDWSAIIGRWRSQIASGKAVSIHGDGEKMRDFTHVKDIVSGLIAIAEYTGNHTDPWELGSGKNISINELFELFQKYFPGIKKEYILDVPGNYPKTIRVNDDALLYLGWNPEHCLEDYIKEIAG